MKVILHPMFWPFKARNDLEDFRQLILFSAVYRYSIMRSMPVFLFCLFLPAFAKAQDELPSENRTFYGGITAGTNFSALQGDVYAGYHKVGFNVGGVVYTRFLQIFTAGIEMLYSQKGCRGVREINSSYVGQMFEKYYVNLNYVEVPLIVSIEFSPFLSFGGGISYSRLINSKEWIVSDQPYNIDNSLFRFQRDDWAYVGGATLQFKKQWAVGLRYQQSFKPIRDSYYIPLGLGTGAEYNSYFTLRLTYLIL